MKAEDIKDVPSSDSTSYTNAEAQLIEENPIRITLSGHTNAGKTEWLSSLLMKRVGETSPAPDTTRQIRWERYALSTGDGSRPYIMLADVPGQNFSSDIWGIAEKELGPRPKPQQMDDFIKRHKEVTGDYQPDIVLLEHFRACDVILYLADCQGEPVTGIEDEFELVRRLGRPVIAVLNYSGAHIHDGDSVLKQWREAFISEGARSVVGLDAFDKDPQAIRELGEQIVSALSEQPLKAKFARVYWQKVIMVQEEERIGGALNTLADFMVSAASCRVRESVGSGKDKSETEKHLKSQVKECVRKEVRDLLSAILRAYPEFSSVLSPAAYENQQGIWVQSIYRAGFFERKCGMLVCGGIGGIAGVGLAGGVGVLLGIVFGFGVSRKVISKIRFKSLGRYMEVQLSDRTLTALCVNGLALIDALRRRGIASDIPLDIEAHRQRIPPLDNVLKTLGKARKKRTWSRWRPGWKNLESRQMFVDNVAMELGLVLEKATQPPVAQMNAIDKVRDELRGRFSGTFKRIQGYLNRGDHNRQETD